MNSQPTASTSIAPKDLTALTAVQMLFGVNYVVSKVIVEALPPLVWASIRVVIAAVVMFIIALLSGRKPPKLGREFYGYLVIYALLGIIINQGCFLVGLYYTTSTNSAILNTLIPVFTLAIVTLRGQEALTLKRAIGFCFAFAGVLVIRHVENLSLSDRTLIGDALTIINCLSFSLFLSYSKKFMEETDPVWTTAWLFVYGSIGLSLFAIPSYMSIQWPPLTQKLLLCMAYSIIGGTLLTYFLNLWTLAHVRSSSVALFIYLQPVVASLLAWFWFNEIVTLRTILSSVLIFIGMLLALAKPKPVA